MEQNVLEIMENENMEIQEVLNPEVVNYLNTKEKVETFKMFKGLVNYAATLFAILGVFITGYKLDGTNTNIKATTEHVLVGTYNNDYTDSKYDDVILIRDSVGVTDEVKEEVRQIVADELSCFTDEFIDEFLANTKFEIEIRDSYCYSDGFGRNVFLHWLDKYNFSQTDGQVRAYFEGAQGILRVHAYTHEDNISINIKDSLHHELGHYFDTASFRFSSSEDFMKLYEKYAQEEYIAIRVTRQKGDDGNYYNTITTAYPLSAPYEFFAEMFQQYVDYTCFLAEEYPDVFEYFLNLLEK